MEPVMFHTPAHKNVSAPAGQAALDEAKKAAEGQLKFYKKMTQLPKTLGDDIKDTEQQMKKEELTTGQLLKTCFHRAVEQTSDLGNKWDHWELAASMFLKEVKNNVSSKP